MTASSRSISDRRAPNASTCSDRSHQQYDRKRAVGDGDREGDRRHAHQGKRSDNRHRPSSFVRTLSIRACARERSPTPGISTLPWAISPAAQERAQSGRSTAPLDRTGVWLISSRPVASNADIRVCKKRPRAHAKGMAKTKYRAMHQRIVILYSPHPACPALSADSALMIG
jgi:hypothetical protein